MHCEAIGVVWMTLVMRSNLEQFGTYISLDAMKRKTNVHLWAYFGVVVKNEFSRPVVCCEALMFGKTRAAYTFLIQSMLSMCPTRKGSHIMTVFADKFITEDMLKDFGLPCAKLVWDQYHLKCN